VPSLSLTFDDGPDPDGTPVLLDLLSDLGARATFFPIAPRAAQHPALIARALAEGHAVGLHCERHVRHSEQDLESVREDTVRALARLRSLGAQPVLWRTPWGDLAPFSSQLATEHELRLVGWTVDTHDWRGDAASDMFERVRAELHDRAVVLAHDGIGPGARRSTVEQTIELVRLIAADAAERGLRIEALT
jgi:peptidoglycan/xylan/chitin deacetylase (PgdA/CDA1 family)